MRLFNRSPQRILFGNQELTNFIAHNFRKYGKSGAYTLWDFSQKTKGGLWVGYGKRIHNIWHDDGEEWLAKAVFSRNDGVALFNQIYIGLDNRTSPGETNNLGNLSGEPTSNGYSRQAVDTTTGTPNDWTASLTGGDWQAASAQQTFSASGGSWGPVQQAWLTDKNTATSGKYLICTAALSTSRTLNDGDSLKVTYTISFKEPA